MKRQPLAVAAFLGLLSVLLAPDQAWAQGRGMNYRPSVSPYLALTQGGGNFGVGAFNYFTIVRPELEFRSLINRQASDIQRLETRVKESTQKSDLIPKQEEFTLPRTGHRVYFSNASHYYGSWR